VDHLEAIVELKNAINLNFIKKMIAFIDHKAKDKMTIKSGIHEKVRDVKGYVLNFETPNNLFYWNYIKNEIERLYICYKAKFPFMYSEKIYQIDLLKYSVGDHYKVHTDQFATAPRQLSIIMNLNDDYEGGELIFTDQKQNEIKTYNLGKGSIVFFPSNFMYPHSIKPITKGTRYSIVAWLR